MRPTCFRATQLPPLNGTEGQILVDEARRYGFRPSRTGLVRPRGLLDGPFSGRRKPLTVEAKRRQLRQPLLEQVRRGSRPYRLLVETHRGNTTIKRYDEKFVSSGRAVVIGEWGAADKSNLDARLMYYEVYAKACADNQITPIVWIYDYDRTTLQWKNPSLEDKILSVFPGN